MSDKKLKSFNISTVASKKHLSKKELEDQRKKEEEVAAAAAYEEFVAAFEDASKHGKTFVRGTTFNAGTREDKTSKDTGKIYKLSAKLPEVLSPGSATRKQDAKEEAKRKDREKKKSNLEIFKEELKMIQEEREERHKMKAQMKDSTKPSRFSVSEESSPPKAVELVVAPLEADYKPPVAGSFDTGDPSTTNLYLGNLNPKMTEQQLCEVFGKYGPLASVKIMWPRSEEEKARGRNCGFVAYMNRKDGERALKALNGKDVMSYEMKLGWGKAVPLPPHPVYIPPALAELTMPPPPSGLPFNAQPDRKDREKFENSHAGSYPSVNIDKVEIEKILMNAVVKVVIPTERNLLSLIHRMIEFVVREGPMFEAMIMNRELNNPMFRFLFENQSPVHVYYRWKLFSILQGDSPNKWRVQEFRMFKCGSWWRPPPMNPYSQGMPEELVEAPEDPHPKKGQLSNSQRDRLEDMLRNLTSDRSKISDSMVYCIEHAEAAIEIVSCITESLTIFQTPLPKKIARLYLVSDILHNCSVKIANASYYRKGFQSKLIDVFKSFRECHQAIEGRLKAEQFKQKVMRCFRQWEECAIYPNDFLIRLQNLFLGLETDHDTSQDLDAMMIEEADEHSIEDIDGVPIGYSGADLDGVPLNDGKEDIDGVPMFQEGKRKKSSDRMSPKLKYAPSKWETVDPNIIEAQAMTTSKWDLLDQQEDDQFTKVDEDDIDGRPMEDDDGDSNYEQRELLEYEVSKSSEERRAKLREIELKVAKFQDELEGGKRTRKGDMTMMEQVEHYRQKLLRKERNREEELDRRKDFKRSPSSESYGYDARKYSVRESSPSPKRITGRSRSRSPRTSRSSRSRSPRRRQHSIHSPGKTTRSRSPKIRRRSPSSPTSRHHSDSRSPLRHVNKSRKSKH